MSEFAADTVIEHEGCFTRLKNAFFGVLIGLGMFFFSFLLLFWNEGRSVAAINGLLEAERIVVTVAADKIDAANDKKLVHTNGEAKTEETLKDSEFPITVRALKLVRKAEMYQYKERKESRSSKSAGGSKTTRTEYYYDKVWSESHIKSNTFYNSSYQNPHHMPYKSQDFLAKKVTLGAFEMPDALINQIRKREDINLASQFAEGNTLPMKTTIQQNYLFIPNEMGSSLENPKIGDVRVSFQFVPNTVVSVMAQQQGNQLGSMTMASGYTIHCLYDGTLSSGEMIERLRQLNTIMTWILRIGGFLMMTFGCYLILRPLEVMADVVPMIGSIVGFGLFVASLLVSIVGSTITIGIAWLFYRPILGGSLIAIAVAITIWMVTRKNSAKSAEIAS